MAGLSLRTGVTVGGGYSPMAQPAAMSPTATSVAQRAYGINGTGGGNGNRAAGLGSTAIGTVALGLLVYLWWSLPR